MLLRKRCRHGPCRLHFLVLLLMLGCTLLMVAMLPPPPHALDQTVTAQAAQHSQAAGYRLDFGESQEWVLESEDEDQEYGPLEGLPPFISREDQLLVAVASPRVRRNQSQGRRSGSYRLIKQPSRRLDQEASEKDWGAEEEDEEVSEEDELTTLGLEEALSARIPLQRALPEVRHPLCRQQRPEDSLPTASVILCFHDEAWSTLLRTVHSILDTAPRAFLKEIILVDDLSQQGQLRTALSEHVARLEGVKLLRSNKRLGAIRARMLGATRATGDVLVFMDAHCECHPGWLEPLLSRIAGDRSPVVPGGVVAMDRHYFQNTGAYDPLMSLRGGENLELSLKTWLCGGSVEILPCSRVGHIYKNQDAESPLDPEATLLNKVRIAETWLGSFKETFYKHSPKAFSLSKAEKPDCTERLQLQRRLGCRTFHWFLANVYPEMYPSEHRPRFSGKLHNTGLGFCADCQAEGDLLGCALMLAPCSNSRQQQHLQHAGRKEIHFGSPQHLCFDVRREQVVLQNCTEGGPAIHQQHWDFQENGMIVHVVSGKCMEAVVQENNKDLYLRQCDGKASQLWHFDNVKAMDEH
ncbi:polypeptide N-acetylgalactosaminyltransferase 15 isoform X2 [Artibeus jamaicensis]|uniref:polypeptide N-acetylgalactosaminyltransferase 15 isoform X2 n=1 Tax=Artibeus jamaicensis TaxID=9417 RepID=UPI00235B0B1F|nr:polypeptide N-acetylgalactosaminyltransferase 15 isoform X2 [Artibeus jamaicensis]